MKQYITGFFPTVCLIASVFMFMGSQNLNEKIDIDFINMQKTVDLTVDKDSECSLHSKGMSKTVVNIIYGLPSERLFEEIKMSKTRFPNGRAKLLGGCVIRDGQIEKAIIYQCQSCVEVQNVWFEKYWKTLTDNWKTLTGYPPN